MVTTLYLKYRPQTFTDLDSFEAREELQKVFKSGKFPHAFLFSGPRGIGKTSAARIVAKVVNCKKQSDEPCNKCDSCISITHGTNVDILEIDAASNRGIDDIKDLREKIRLAPSSAKFKVYIIDEAHMLTTEAFNALLKTLEEPPAHALFILCTTDPEKLPKTIISRCHRVNFKKATKAEIVSRLKKVCASEGIEFEEKALAEIGKMADGGFRDAIKILGQVAMAGKVTVGEAQKTAGVTGEFKVDDFLGLLQKRQTKEALAWINQAVEKGANLRIMTENILENLRILLLARFGFEEAGGDDFDFNPEEIKTLINLFSRAYFGLRSAVIPQLPLEMAVVEWSSFAKAPEDKSESSKDKKADENIEKKDLSSSAFSLADILSKWPQILEKVKPLNHSVVAFLKATRPIACEDGFLVLEVFYKFHKDQLEKEQCRRIFEASASEVIGCPIKLRCSLSENAKIVAKPLPQLDNFPPPVTPPTVTAKKEGGDDIIKLAEEIFNKGGTLQ